MISQKKRILKRSDGRIHGHRNRSQSSEMFLYIKDTVENVAVQRID